MLVYIWLVPQNEIKSEEIFHLLQRNSTFEELVGISGVWYDICLFIYLHFVDYWPVFHLLVLQNFVARSRRYSLGSQWYSILYSLALFGHFLRFHRTLFSDVPDFGLLSILSLNFVHITVNLDDDFIHTMGLQLWMLTHCHLVTKWCQSQIPWSSWV